MKKFLSVFLSLAMTVSLFTVGASAKSNNTKKTFTDNGSIQYQEAVSVVSACEIIDGYKDGSFNPTATLTRGAAAKIICNMMLGPTTASALDANAAPFKDVSTKNVFAGYIAYCAKEGIINGYKDKTFRPTKTVTGFQFMKMLLGALGYDGSIEGFTGKNWTIPVAKLASSSDLDDGNDNFVGSKAMTREEACLYAFNTLKATMVEYNDKGSTITVNGATIVQSASKAEDKVNNSTKTDGNIESDKLMQFAEKYFDKLKSKKSTNDDFGRPGTKWTYDGDEIGTYADESDESLVLNKNGKNLSLDQILVSDSDYFKYDENDLASTIDIYVNGKSRQVKKTDVLKDTSNAKDAVADFEAGDQLFVHENDDNKVDNVTAVRYTLAKIDEIDTSLSSTYTNKGATCSITLTSLDGDTSLGGTYYDQYDGNSSKELKGFSSDTYKKGTVLAVAFSEKDTDKIIASNVATVVSGKVSAYDSGSKAKVTIDGKDYRLHSNIATSDNSSVSVYKDNGNSGLDFNYNDSTYTAYLDVNNYVIGIDETESVKIDDVYYVTGISRSTSGLYGNTYYAQAVALKNGSVTDFKLDTSDDADNNKANYLKNKAASDDNWTTGWTDPQTDPQADSKSKLDVTYAGLYTFEKDGSSYEAKQYNTSSDSTYYVINGSGKVEANEVGNTKAADALADELKHDDTYLKLKDAKSDKSKKVYLGKDTNYLKIATPGSDIDVKFVTGGTSVRNNGVEAITVCTKTGGSKYVASYVILVSANNDFSNSSSDDMVFISDTSNKTVSYTDADGKTKTGYARDLYFLDGSGKVEKDAVCTKEDHGCGYYTWEKNDDGVYDLDPTNPTNDKLTDNWTSTDPAYDDQTGSVSNVRLESVYDNTLTINNDGITCTDSNSKTVTCTLDDVDLAKNVIIADDRSSSKRDDEAYTSEINSVSKLKAAIDKDKSDVYADVYYDDGEVIMVYVWDVTPTGSSSHSGSTVGTTIKGTKKISVATTSDIKGEDNGAYVLNTAPTDADGKPLSLGGTIAQNIFFRYEENTANQPVILRIYNPDSSVVYYEPYTPEKETDSSYKGHIFYVQVLGKDGKVSNAGYESMKDTALTTGDYTWAITSGSTILANGSFTIA